jgi:hypothetical protein
MRKTLRMQALGLPAALRKDQGRQTHSAAGRHHTGAGLARERTAEGLGRALRAGDDRLHPNDYLGRRSRDAVTHGGPNLARKICNVSNYNNVKACYNVTASGGAIGQAPGRTRQIWFFRSRRRSAGSCAAGVRSDALFRGR